MPSPTPKPGDLAAQATAEVDRRSIDALLGRRRPELQRVAMTAATMAMVAIARHVHRETAATTVTLASRQGTAPVPLGTRSTHGLEPQQVQHRLHRHRRANPLEVNAGCEPTAHRLHRNV